MSYNFFSKNNILLKIICVSLVFFISIIYQFTTWLISSIHSSKSIVEYIISILYNFGEERLLRTKSETISFPRHFAIILDKENFTKIFKNLLKITYWNILTGIKQFTIYDPFNILESEVNLKTLCDSLASIYNTNYSILLTTENFFYDCRKNEKISLTNQNFHTRNYHIIISIINFKNANQDLIQEIFQKNSFNLVCLPKPLRFINQKENLEKKYKFEFEKFFTKKNSESLPELICSFSSTGTSTSSSSSLCLYGFPFTMLENAEIISPGKLSSLNVVKYVHIFEKFSKIDKRFGK